MKPQDNANANAPQQSSSPSLLQLASETILVNLLPVMALRPSRILQVRLGDSGKSTRLDQAAALFRQALQALAQEPAFKGYQPKVVDVTLPGISPDIAETREFIATTLLSNPGMIVNFSGGTKLMSIGTYLAAMAFGRASFACDPQTQRFSNGRTAPLDRLPDVATLNKHFSIRLLMAVQGRNLDDWRSETPTDPLRAFGLKAFELRNQHWGVLDNFNKALRAHFYTQGDKVPQEEEAIRALATKPLPASVTSSEPARQYLTAAAAAGLVKIEGPNYRLHIPQFNRRTVERAVQLIISGWVDLAVLDCLQRNPRYQTPLWNFEPASQQASAHDDSDILCIDSKHGTLQLICCKAAMTRSPHDHLESLAERVQRLGGNAAGMFVLFKPSSGQESAIRNHARRLGLEVAIEADEIVKAFSPHVK